MSQAINTTIVLKLNDTIPGIRYSSVLPQECLNEGKYSVNCLTQLLCPQISSYFIKAGIIIIISYVIISWISWWFFKHGYKSYTYSEDSAVKHFIGDLQKLETRVYWMLFIKDKMVKVCLGYIAVLVWMFMK